MSIKKAIGNFVVICLASSFNSFSSCNDQKFQDDANYNPAGEYDSSFSINLSVNQKKTLEGAKKCLRDAFKYDKGMSYRVLEYENGEYTGAKVFPGGDLEPGLGVCTEVTIRALRYGNIADLQEAIHDDLKASWNDYPMKRWKAKKPDSNIDHRRVPNQLVWFRKHWQELNRSDWQPGDIVVWDMDSDGWGDHIGIVSDRFIDGTPCVIHNFPEPGYVAEENVLNRWEIIGHFRVWD
jgi:uncharacterized protein YijF (DUF1287 family)